MHACVSIDATNCPFLISKNHIKMNKSFYFSWLEVKLILIHIYDYYHVNFLCCQQLANNEQFFPLRFGNRFIYFLLSTKKTFFPLIVSFFMSFAYHITVHVHVQKRKEKFFLAVEFNDSLWVARFQYWVDVLLT